MLVQHILRILTTKTLVNYNNTITKYTGALLSYAFYYGMEGNGALSLRIL